jgi:diguanylate cyclase (GGDEF)-like protein/PAS domain S-box-containing protein
MQANDKVTLQLKWFHQFQFAGYYAAKEKGFYDEVGLDVEIKERDLKHNNIQQVIDGEAEYGVADSILLLYKAKKEPIVIVSAIFQHSPSVLISLKSNGIYSPYDLNNKDIIFYENDTDSFAILAMLKKLNIKPNLIRYREKDDYLKLKDNEVDGSPAYLSNEPFYFKKQNIKINTINPKHYGFDLYGDMLFANKNEVQNHPDRVKKFKEATLKGWQYALKHKEEIINLIHNKYNSTKSIEHLRFEAEVIDDIINIKEIPLGFVDEGRIKYIYNLYKDYGLTENDLDVQSIIFKEYKFNNFDLSLTVKEKEYLKNNPVLTVQNMKAFPPFNFNENETAMGFSIDYLKLIGKILNTKIEFISGKSWAESLDMIKDRSLDIIPQIAINNERKEFIDFTNLTHVEYMPSLVVRKNSDIKTMKDLDGKVVSVLNKSINHSILIKYFPNIHIDLVSKASDSVRSVAIGKSDAAIDDLSLLEYYIHKNWFSNVETIILNNTYIKKIPLYMGVSKNNSTLLSILDKANAEIKHDEVIRLKKKWINRININTNNQVDFNNKEKNYLKNKKVLKMCIDPNWMPYERIENGKHIGITSDYIKLFQEQLPIDIKLITTTSWIETVKNTKNKKCDFITIMIKTSEREKHFNFSSNYLKSPIVITTKMNEPFINNVLDVLDKKFGIVNGYAYKDILIDKYPTIKIVDVKNVEDGLEKVENGKLFGFIDSLPTVGYSIQKNHADSLKVTGKIEGDWSFSLASRIDEPLLNDIFNKLILNIPDDKRHSILNKWISVKYQESVDYTKIIWISVILVLIMMIVVYKNRTISTINKKMESYIEMVDDNILTSSTDLDGKITSASQAFCNISGYTKEELVGQYHSIVRHEDMPDELFSDLWKVITEGKTWKGEIKNKKKNGGYYWIDAIISPRYNEANRLIGFISVRHDITDKKRVEYLSISDELTTLYNKRHFNAILKKEINRAKRVETRFSFMMFDVDFFKQYNDTYGHQMGDLVLSSIGKTLREICKRSTDMAFRIGGEEFAVIFYADDAKNAFAFAERIRTAIEALNIEHKFNKASAFVTVSTGLYTELGRSIKTGEEIYLLSDTALYKAKSLGRNQTIKV